MKQSMIAMAMCALTAFAHGANSWYANAKNAAGTGDGLTVETGYHTIQEAVDRAAAGDTVYVAPGTYDEGGGEISGPSAGYTQYARVVITNKIKLVSTLGCKGRDVTHVVGDWNGGEGVSGCRVCSVSVRRRDSAPRSRASRCAMAPRSWDGRAVVP